MKLLSLVLVVVVILSTAIASSSRTPKVETSTTSTGNDIMKRRKYIVYMGAINDDITESRQISKAHQLLLEEVAAHSNGQSKLVRSYHRSFKGFVAELTEDEAAAIAARDDVVSIFPDGELKLHTTRSWDFLGLTSTADRSIFESNIIIGFIDTGVRPESESFSDRELGPPPAKWKGICQSSANFTCNNKIIGARYYMPDESNLSPNDSISPRDTKGHGTHTASTAAGVATLGSLFGYANGTARGAVPSARLAVYKVCWQRVCEHSALLAAFDDAIADGVDIISISIGVTSPYLPYYFTNPVAIGAFHSMKKRVLTVASAGNRGPLLGTLTNFAPWSLDVAASSVDRKFVTKIGLRNRRFYEGTSINTFDLGSSMYPLVTMSANDTSGSWMVDSMDPTYVKGKIVVCNSCTKDEADLRSAGAVGYLEQGGCDTQIAEVSTTLPYACLSANDSSQISGFINSTREALATILKTTEGFDPYAPTVATFSSRGPNELSPNILKPDITAPGINILASWSAPIPAPNFESDPHPSTFNVISGTSMACPHASGAAAYVKQFHPDWSASAIKSALMTTATPLRPQDNNGAEFGYGNGMLNPTKAVYPGLIYDAEEGDYVRFLCSQGYATEKVQLITGDNSTCDDQADDASTSSDLNYPSMTLVANSSAFVGAFKRTVTNVGNANSMFKVNATGPPSLKIVVEPGVLWFSHVGQKMSFVVRVQGTLENANVPLSGSILWSDGVHEVRSPVVVYAFSILEDIKKR